MHALVSCFAINSLTSPPNNRFIICNSTTNINVSGFFYCYDWKLRSTNHILIFKIPGLYIDQSDTRFSQTQPHPRIRSCIPKIAYSSQHLFNFCKKCISFLIYVFRVLVSNFLKLPVWYVPFEEEIYSYAQYITEAE